MLPDTFNLADYSTAELKHIYEYLKNAFEGQDINLERELIEHYPDYSQPLLISKFINLLKAT